MLPAGLTFVLLTSACFNVEAPQTYRCSAAEPACPPGLICNSNLCVNKGAADAASDVAADSTPDISKDVSPAPDTQMDASPPTDTSTKTDSSTKVDS
jgi:hypothetical protein